MSAKAGAEQAHISTKKIYTHPVPNVINKHYFERLKRSEIKE